MIPMSEITRNFIVSVLRILGVGLIVVIGLGQAPMWTGTNWLRHKVVRISGVLVGLAVIIGSSHFGGVLQSWLQGGR